MNKLEKSEAGMIAITVEHLLQRHSKDDVISMLSRRNISEIIDVLTGVTGYRSKLK